jgi:tight adherence protein B
MTAAQALQESQAVQALQASLALQALQALQTLPLGLWGGPAAGWLASAALLAGSAAWVAWPVCGTESRLRPLRRRPSSLAGSAAMISGLPQLALPEFLILIGGTAAALHTGYPLLMLLCPALVIATRRRRRRAALRRETDLRRAEVRRFCVALSAELRAGRAPPDAALRAAVPVPGRPAVLHLSGIGRAAACGLEATKLLRAAAQAPGAEALRRVATCWTVAEHRGAGLADAIDRLVDGLMYEESQRQEVAAQLAGARATARLLAVLPAFGLLLGAGIGANPIHVLLGTPYGFACLLLGGALNACGLLWTEHLAHAAEGAS